MRKRNSDMLIEMIELAGRRVIDVGSGDGALSRLMARHGARVTGIECQPRQLAKARSGESMDGLDFVDGIAQALPTADATIDVVVFFNSLHHVPVADQPQALAEAARVLVPGGLVYVSEPVAEGPFFDLVRQVDDETEVRAAALTAIRQADRFGLRPVKEVHYVHTVRQNDFDSFRDRIVSANPERDRRFTEHEDELRQAFATMGEPAPAGGRLFDQPMRVNLLTKGEA